MILSKNWSCAQGSWEELGSLKKGHELPWKSILSHCWLLCYKLYIFVVCTQHSPSVSHWSSGLWVGQVWTSSREQVQAGTSLSDKTAYSPTFTFSFPLFVIQIHTWDEREREVKERDRVQEGLLVLLLFTNVHTHMQPSHRRRPCLMVFSST